MQPQLTHSFLLLVSYTVAIGHVTGRFSPFHLQSFLLTMLLPQGKKPHWQRLLREAARSAGSCIQSHFALHSYPIVSVANHQISYDVVTSWSPCSATTGPTGCSRNGTLALPYEFTGIIVVVTPDFQRHHIAGRGVPMKSLKNVHLTHASSSIACRMSHLCLS
jgi:hypothetical protein